MDDQVRNDTYVYWDNKRTFNAFLGLVKVDFAHVLYDRQRHLRQRKYGYLNDPYREVMPASGFYQTDPTVHRFPGTAARAP